MKYILLLGAGILLLAGWSHAQDEGLGVGSVEEVTVDADLGASREGSRTAQSIEDIDFKIEFYDSTSTYIHFKLNKSFKKKQ